MEHSIRHEFNLPAKKMVRIDQYQALAHNQMLYVIIPVQEEEQLEIIERYEMTKHLIQQGEMFVPTFYPSIDGRFIGGKEGNYYILLQVSTLKERNQRFLGKKLAKFHRRGTQLTSIPNALNRLGVWKDVWIKRLEQMESFWETLLHRHPSNSFEEALIEVFPYYLGLSENAIQYYVDTTIDETPQMLDRGTICHEQFNDNTWGEKWLWKNPFDWVFDHYSRDLAEWVRSAFLKNSHASPQMIHNMLKEYQSIIPITPFGWRILYSRLIFPIHFFQVVEEYYLANSEEEKNLLEKEFHQIVNESDLYERLLVNLFDYAEVPTRTYHIPTLHWVKKSFF